MTVVSGHLPLQFLASAPASSARPGTSCPYAPPSKRRLIAQLHGSRDPLFRRRNWDGDREIRRRRADVQHELLLSTATGGASGVVYGQPGNEVLRAQGARRHSCRPAQGCRQIVGVPCPRFCHRAPAGQLHLPGLYRFPVPVEKGEVDAVLTCRCRRREPGFLSLDLHLSRARVLSSAQPRSATASTVTTRQADSNLRIRSSIDEFQFHRKIMITAERRDVGGMSILVSLFYDSAGSVAAAGPSGAGAQHDIGGMELRSDDPASLMRAQRGPANSRSVLARIPCPRTGAGATP